MTSVLHEGGRELARFETREEAKMWLGQNATSYELVDEHTTLFTKMIVIIVKDR